MEPQSGPLKMFGVTTAGEAAGLGTERRHDKDTPMPRTRIRKLAKDKTKRPILITIIKILYIATALIKFPNKRRWIIRDACSMRFTEGSQFSMNVKDEHKTSKVWFIKCPWHKISRYKRPAELATAKYAHAYCVQFILVSHWGPQFSHKLHEASFHCYILGA